MGLRFAGAAALVAAYALGSASNAWAQNNCRVHVYPADGVHSVGEDLDAVHRVDQDLRHYYETAGRSLDWLTPARQATLLQELPLAELAGAPSAALVMHPEPLTRHQAIAPGAHEPGDCVVEVMLPKIMLERGGLAQRSLRLFGVIRRYESGSLVRSYSGDAASPMTGFQLKSPADAEAATQIVEQAYRGAAETLLRNSAKPPRR